MQPGFFAVREHNAHRTYPVLNRISRFSAPSRHLVVLLANLLILVSQRLQESPFQTERPDLRIGLADVRDGTLLCSDCSRGQRSAPLNFLEAGLAHRWARS